MSEFKYGDMVEVRDWKEHKWQSQRFYLGSVPIPNGGMRHYTMREGGDESNFDGIPICWNYVRKPELTIEERLDRIEKMLRNLQNL
jgi:hypothetical protein